MTVALVLSRPDHQQGGREDTGHQVGRGYLASNTEGKLFRENVAVMYCFKVFWGGWDLTSWLPCKSMAPGLVLQLQVPSRWMSHHNQSSHRALKPVSGIGLTTGVAIFKDQGDITKRLLLVKLVDKELMCFSNLCSTPSMRSFNVSIKSVGWVKLFLTCCALCCALWSPLCLISPFLCYKRVLV